MSRRLLTDQEIRDALDGLPGWSREGKRLVKTYVFPTFPEGIRFVSEVANRAEEANHHPDIDIRYTKVTCSLSTHDSGGITRHDAELAAKIEEVATRLGEVGPARPRK